MSVRPIALTSLGLGQSPTDLNAVCNHINTARFHVPTFVPNGRLSISTHDQSSDGDRSNVTTYRISVP